jgi:TonB family protein
MISTRTLVLLVACSTGPLAASAVTPAAEKNFKAGLPAAADTQLIADWMQLVDSAEVVTLSHAADFHRPVRFKSRKPCVYRLTRVITEARLAGTAPARFAEGLGLRERLPDTALCHPRPCRIDARLPFGPSGDTLVSQRLRLTFRRPGQEVTFDVGSDAVARITDPSQRWACLPLANRVAGLVVLARQALPEDTLLARMAPCEPAVPDSGSPIVGDYVYVEELPEVVERQTPHYPDQARASNVSGTVLVQALIGSNGEVKSTAIVESIPLLDPAAVQAVERWRFRPAMSNGKPVAVWVAVPVKFSLKY